MAVVDTRDNNHPNEIEQEPSLSPSDRTRHHNRNMTAGRSSSVPPSPTGTGGGQTKRMKRVKRSESHEALWEMAEDKRETKDEIKRSAQDPVPLRNLGNTCYMNSMVQSLFIFGSFFTFLAQKTNEAKQRLPSLLETPFKMTQTLLSAYNEYCKQQLSQDITDEMDNQMQSLRFSVAERSSQFKTLVQQDTVEFLTLVLGTIDEEFESCVTPEENPVKIFFELECDSHLNCLKCGQDHQLPKQATQAMYLCIPAANTESEYGANRRDGFTSDELTLQEIILGHLKAEQIEHKCEASNCDGRVKVRTVRVSKLPKVLILQLGRYAEDGSKRLETVHAPPQVVIPNELFNNIYTLMAVICHNGSTLYSGHYVAYVYREENQTWYYCDDDVIIPVCLEKVQDRSKHSGYCFFYINEAI